MALDGVAVWRLLSGGLVGERIWRFIFVFLMLIQKDLETWRAWCWVRTQAVGAEELTPFSAPVTLGGSQLHLTPALGHLMPKNG